jgi:drug/metabolite transporter (DMT)-like permease
LDFVGELAALGSALLWALASVAYGRIGQVLPPLGLNLSKGVIAIALIGITLLLRQEAPPILGPVNLGLLLLSGIIGIGVGDTLYFEALQRLGVRRTLLLKESLAPPMAAALAVVFLAELLPWVAWGGIVLTLLGVLWVISERTPQTQEPPGHHLQGVILGLLAALGQAVGAVLSRAALAETPIPPLWGALLRLLAGVTVLLLWGLLRREVRSWFKGFHSRRLWLGLCLAAFGGTYLGIWLQQVGLKYAPAGVAQTLGATSPLFVLPIALWLGEEIRLRAWLGAGLALAGISLLFWLR